MRGPMEPGELRNLLARFGSGCMWNRLVSHVNILLLYCSCYQLLLIYRFWTGMFRHVPCWHTFANKAGMVRENMPFQRCKLLPFSVYCDSWSSSLRGLGLSLHCFGADSISFENLPKPNFVHGDPVHWLVKQIWRFHGSHVQLISRRPLPALIVNNTGFGNRRGISPPKYTSI